MFDDEPLLYPCPAPGDKIAVTATPVKWQPMVLYAKSQSGKPLTFTFDENGIATASEACTLITYDEWRALSHRP